jgi:hypothetical protein
VVLPPALVPFGWLVGLLWGPAIAGYGSQLLRTLWWEKRTITPGEVAYPRAAFSFWFRLEKKVTPVPKGGSVALFFFVGGCQCSLNSYKEWECLMYVYSEHKNLSKSNFFLLYAYELGSPLDFWVNEYLVYSSEKFAFAINCNILTLIIKA